MAKPKAKKKKSKMSKTKSRNSSVASEQPANQQEQRKFMQLPQELRDLIFSHLFCSTRFSSGERAYGRIDHRRIIPAFQGTALAILRTCRTIHNEIGTNWLGQVLFHFERPEAMLDKLGKLDISRLQLVRHVRVSGDPLMLSFGEDDVYYRTAQALKLLPGLNLDVLTILASRIEQVSYETLDMLVRYGNGFKELRYISHSSEFLGYKDDMIYFGPSDPSLNRYLRQPQPANWQEALEHRDDQGSTPSVVIYRSKKAATPNAIFHAEDREAYFQSFANGQDASSYGTTEDRALMKPRECEKEIMVVVRRGDGVDYAEKQGSPFLQCGDIRQDFCDEAELSDNNIVTWAAIKAWQSARFKEIFGDDDSDEADDEDAYFGGHTEPTLVDSYTNVDEYTWPPLHFSRE